MTITTLVLTGAADSLPDFTFKTNSITGTRKSGEESRFNFSLPFVDGYLDAYDARLNGDLLCYADGVLLLECNPDVLNYNVSAVNKNITIQATKHITNSNPTTHDFTGRIERIRRGTDGKQVFSVVGFSDILPLDAIKFYSADIGDSCYNILEYRITINNSGYAFELVEDSVKNDCFS